MRACSPSSKKRHSTLGLQHEFLALELSHVLCMARIRVRRVSLGRPPTAPSSLCVPFLNLQPSCLTVVVHIHHLGDVVEQQSPAISNSGKDSKREKQHYEGIRIRLLNNISSSGGVDEHNASLCHCWWGQCKADLCSSQYGSVLRCVHQPHLPSCLL